MIQGRTITYRRTYFSHPGNVRYQIQSPILFDVTMEQIFKTICEHMKVAVEDALSKVRKRDFVEVRSLFCYFSRTMLKKNFRQISEVLDTQHDMAIFHVKKVNNLMESDKKYKASVNKLKNHILLKYKR